ncbi:hypothetical protein RB620_06840 [Paenibacillus sp. LHD-117]|uniref:DUF7408 domain-containing protein n=1 Tax=Paenibacillus sp. LHD-117 TaxID=3071412 RepID=UPI0027DF683F|nr:hypothetical protein [Paenibacillus sp. LHD-117]MDQ6419154.1 hypothetical protein [Paenibacillus sp. LHD-117]
MKEERTYRQYKFVKVVIALIGIMMAWPALAAQAEPEKAVIDLQSAVGFQGNHKEGRWYPARVTLTNESDEALKGELVLSYINGDNGTTDAVVPLELPPGSPVQVTLGIPGVVLNKDTNRVAFYEGTYQSRNSESVKVSGRGYLDSRSSLSYMIGVVSRDPDTFNFMPTLNQKGYDIAVYPMQPDDLPEESHLLDSLDVIVINDTATGDWSEGRIRAIKEWVTRGGTLVLSGGAGYAKTSEAFAELSPIEATGTAQVESSAALAAAGGEALSLPLGLTVSTGKPVRGTATIVEGDVPLAVTAEHGFGHVVYAAFDPSLEPLSSWAGSAMLWAKLLSPSMAPLQQINGGNVFGGYMNEYWQMKNVIDQFPSIKQPELFLLIAMLGLYILVIAPLLYIVLAKVDRREWAWWLIPVLSVAMGVTVFLIGSGDKRNITTHTVEIIELSNDGHAVVSGGTGIFTPAGGTISAKFDERLPLRMYGDSGMMGGLNANGQYQLQSGGSDETLTVWRSVPYWSTRKLWMDRRAADAAEIGALGIAYNQENGTTRITVTNDTPDDLTDVYLLMNGAALKIGDLKQGESGSVAKPASAVSTQTYYNYGGTVFPYPANGMRADEDRRERELLDLYFNKYNGTMFPLKPLIVGFSTDQESKYLVNGGKVKSDNLKMWLKELDPLEHTGSRMTVPAGSISPIVLTNTLQKYELYGDGNIHVGAGELELEYIVPNSYGVAYDKLEVHFPNGGKNASMTWSIWNEKKGQWTELTDPLEPPPSYLTAAQSIRIKMTSAVEGNITLPQVALEGEVLQP